MTTKNFTLIQVSNELWKRLNDLKTPEERTFEDVIWKNLNKGGLENEKTNKVVDVESPE